MYLDESFCGCMLSFLWGVYTGVEALSLKIGVYLTLLERAKKFLKVVILLHTPTSKVSESQLLQGLANAWNSQSS